MDRQSRRLLPLLLTLTLAVAAAAFGSILPRAGIAEAAADGFQYTASGGTFTCALTVEGGVKCWGHNTAGQLGDGLGGGASAPSLTPVDVSGLSSGVQQVTAGMAHGCALLSTGPLKCWGSNQFGEIGDGGGPNRLVPVDVSDLDEGVMQVAAGGLHSCALMQTGEVKCWGWNAFNELGRTSGATNVPGDVEGLDGLTIVAIEAGGYSDAGVSCALTDTGGVRCWGSNSFGELGRGTPGVSSGTPAAPEGYEDDGARQIAVGPYNVCVLTTEDTVQCWGRNEFGAVGTGSTGAAIATPTTVPDLNGVRTIDVGWNRACAVLNDGSVKCWGFQYLGDGLVGSRGTPVDVSGMAAGQLAVSTGLHVSCATSTAGGVKCWGDGSFQPVGHCTTAFEAKPSPVPLCDQGARIFGTVRSQTTVISNARVEACPNLAEMATDCRVVSTDIFGLYDIPGLPAGSYTVRAQSPGAFVPLSRTVELLEDQERSETFILQEPRLGPEGTIDPPNTNPEDVPVLRVGQPFTITANECGGGQAEYRITKAGVVIDQGELPEVRPGLYRKQIMGQPPVFYGPVEIFIRVVCPGLPPIELGLDIYIDPSGFVNDQSGAGIANATVTLYRAEVASGPFEVVPDGSVIMSPSNRENPDLTDATGYFGWDVLTGYYFVRATYPGCTDPQNAGKDYVDTIVYEVPPPVFDIDLRLQCPDSDDDGVSDPGEITAGSDPENPNSTPETCDGIDNDLDGDIDEGFPDSDNDGIADCVDEDTDTDTDGDGVLDDLDNCPNVANPSQLDTDGDGLGNACDPDDDNDGVSDLDEINAGSDPLDADSTPETCDGVDNDLDGDIDEGFPDSDNDGIADCVDEDTDTDPGGGTGSISGTVSTNSAVVGAYVSACRQTSICAQDITVAGGVYSIANLPAATYAVTVFPPGDLLPQTRTIVLGEGEDADEDFLLLAPVAPLSGTTVESIRTAGGIPVVIYGQPFLITKTGCAPGTGTYEVLLNDNSVMSGSLSLSDTTYSVTLAIDFVGVADIRLHIVCNDSDANEDSIFNIYIDPAGYVVDQNGDPIAGAQVILFQAPLHVVEEGSAIMSPANRTNPDLTDANGHFGWDVTAGSYVVRASATGCVNPADPERNVVDVSVTVPPAVTDLEIVLDCSDDDDRDKDKDRDRTRRATATPTPTATPTRTPTPVPTATAIPFVNRSGAVAPGFSQAQLAAAAPTPPPVPVAPAAVIRPPNTGDAGLAAYGASGSMTGRLLGAVISSAVLVGLYGGLKLASRRSR